MALALALALPLAARVLMASGWLRSPYPELGKALAWQLGVPEPAYNFGRVAPGLYRSARPDERFLHWVHEHYGIRQLVSLSGPAPAHEEARRLGMGVSVYQWRVEQLPPQAELEEVLAALSAAGPVLVHCASGADRTGYAVAALRVRRDGWPLPQAELEMRRYWHRPERWPELHAELLQRFGPGAPSALR